MGKKDETRECIRNSVIRLMRDTDFLQISVKMVVEESGVSRSTFYRYYESVEAVVEEMENEILDGLSFINKMSLSDTIGNSFAESTFSRLARSSILKDYADFIAVVDGPHGDLNYKNRCMKVIKNYLKQRVKRDGVEDKNIDFYLEFMAGGFYQLINYWTVNRPEVTAEEFERIQQNTFDGFLKYYGLNEYNP